MQTIEKFICNKTYIDIRKLSVEAAVIKIKDVFKTEGQNSIISIDNSINDEVLCRLRYCFLSCVIQQHNYGSYRPYPYYEIQRIINIDQL